LNASVRLIELSKELTLLNQKFEDTLEWWYKYHTCDCEMWRRPNGKVLCICPHIAKVFDEKIEPELKRINIELKNLIF